MRSRGMRFLTATGAIAAGASALAYAAYRNDIEARFIGFPAGGHLLLGHEEEVRTQVRSFLAELATERRAKVG